MTKYKQRSIKRFFRRIIYMRAYHSILLTPKWRCLLYRMGGANICDNTYVGKEVLLDEVHPEGIYIGNNVFVGMNTLFVKPVKIGDNCIIGAGSVVVDDIPSNSLAVGNPCKVIEKLSYENNVSDDFM